MGNGKGEDMAGIVTLVFDTTTDKPDKHEELGAVCERALDDLRQRHGALFDLDRYGRQLRWELEVACELGLCTAFLVTAKWAGYVRKRGLFLGPGRGAEAGSLIAYLLGITQIDPILHQLLPERFFYPRVGQPTFHVDVSPTCENHLRWMVAENSLPAELLRDDCHHGIGSPRKMCAPTETCCSFLGLHSLQVVETTLALLRDRKKELPNLVALPLDCREAYELMRPGTAKGIFQIDKQCFEGFLADFVPTCFEDVVALTSLCGRRHLDSGVAQLFVDVRGKRNEMHIPNVLRSFLAYSWNLPLYLEQLVAIAKEVGGMSPQDAMHMAWSIFPKTTSAYDAFEELFIAGAATRGYSTADIDLAVSLFRAYGPWVFTRAHSVAYAHITYWTAFLKAHHPQEFSLAVELQEQETASVQ